MWDAQSLQQYVGRRMELEDMITASQVQRLNATLDLDLPMPGIGDEVPPGWHYLFFPRLRLTRALGPDGMVPEMENGPPDPLPIRLFAASRQTFHRPLRIGEAARQVSELISLAPKEGRSGKLVFATYRHTISTAQGLATEDEWDIVFREGSGDAPQKPPPGQPGPQTLAWERTIDPSPAMLFRFSAVTFNSHRVHYDLPYAREAEHYPGLIVQAPLTAICLLGLARERHPGRTVTAFEMRAKAPLFAGKPFRIGGRPRGDGKSCELCAITPENTVAMEASATFA
jgi:3-methylfumaryl-CoA hydratase